MNSEGVSDKVLNSMVMESVLISDNVVFLSSSRLGYEGSSSLAFENSFAVVGSGVAVSVTGISREKDLVSSMQVVSQICQFACARKPKVSPGEIEVGGVISIRKTGDPG